MAKTTDIAPDDIALERPLHGLTIVELGHSAAAPYAGLILVELGARVIKVENPQGGDYARGWGPPFWGDVATAFLCLNRGKEGITVDYIGGSRTLVLRYVGTKFARRPLRVVRRWRVRAPDHRRG